MKAHLTLATLGFGIAFAVGAMGVANATEPMHAAAPMGTVGTTSAMTGNTMAPVKKTMKHKKRKMNAMALTGATTPANAMAPTHPMAPANAMAPAGATAPANAMAPSHAMAPSNAMGGSSH